MPTEAQCGICAGIEAIRAGKAPNLIAELDNSYVVLGDAQFYRGYCILLAKHHARELFELPRDQARALSDELRSVAEAFVIQLERLDDEVDRFGDRTQLV